MTKVHPYLPSSVCSHDIETSLPQVECRIVVTCFRIFCGFPDFERYAGLHLRDPEMLKAEEANLS